MKCKNCRQNCAWAGKERSEHGKCFVGYIPTTNADRIRSMTDEELADEILRWFNWLNAVDWQSDKIINWLKEEVKNNG